MIKCIAFDMDDTLYDELDYYRSGMTAVSDFVASEKSLNKTVVFNTVWDVFISGNHKTTFNVALDKLGIDYDDQYIKKLVSVIRNHKPAIKLPSDSVAVLENLKLKYKLALITDGFLPAQRLKIQALGIENYFDSIVITEELGREFWKPSPVAFEKVVADLSLNNNECVYVADNLTKDFISPNKMGFKTIQMIRANQFHVSTAPDKSAEPQYVIKDISELPKLLEQFDV